MVSFNFSDSEDTVATQLKGTDVLIACCLIDGLDFANSAKKSGVKRCVPCFDPSVMPRGVRTLRDNKEAILDHLQSLHFPYTIIDVGRWLQINVPRLPFGRIDRNLFLYNTALVMYLVPGPILVMLACMSLKSSQTLGP